MYVLKVIKMEGIIMKNLYKIVVITISILSYSSTEAFLAPITQTFINRSGPIIRNVPVRNFSFSPNNPVVSLLKRTQTFQTLETLQKNPADHTLFRSFFLQHFMLNSAAAVGATQVFNTGFLLSGAVYGAALGNVLRGSLREYRQFLQHNAVRRDLETLKKMVESNFSIVKKDLTHANNAIKTAEESLTKQIGKVHAELGTKIDSTTHTISQSEANLHKQIKGTESILGTQIDRVQGTLETKMGNSQEILETQLGQIATKLNLTQEQVKAILTSQQSLGTNQNKMLDIMIQSLTPTQQQTLGRLFPLNYK